MFLDCERAIIFNGRVFTETKVIVAAFPRAFLEVEEVGNGEHINSMHRQHCNWSSWTDSFNKKTNKTKPGNNSWNIFIICISIVAVAIFDILKVLRHSDAIFPNALTSCSSCFCPCFSCSQLCPQIQTKINFTMTVTATRWCSNQSCYRCPCIFLWNHHSCACVHVFFFLKLYYFQI